MKKKFLVVGGAGYVGSHFCKALAHAGHLPVVYDNLSLGHRWAVKWGALVEGDLHDEAKLYQTLADDFYHGVFHFAANAYVGESVREPLKYYTNNVAGSLSLLRAMKRAQVYNLVFSSSCATYGIPASLPIEETFPQEPINPYGQSKKMAELIFRDEATLGKFKVVCLRYFNAAGCDPELETGEDHDPETHIIPLALMAAYDNSREFTVLGQDYPTPDGTCVRDYIHVADLADAHVRAFDWMEKRPAGFAAMNLGTGRGFSVLEIINAVEASTGRKIRIKHGERRPGDPPTLVASGAMARRELGWNPANSSLDKIIETANAWYLHHHGKKS